MTATQNTKPAVVAERSKIHEVVRAAQSLGQSVGVVMTMGALHEGHLSLVRRCSEENDVVIATVFVNPTQFLPGEDFQKYPRQLETDRDLLASAGADYLFAPGNEEMYPDNASTVVKAPDVSLRLEGEHRPGHFDGVCTIVCKLFQSIPVNRAYFGSKDYQQFLVIQHMVKDLGIPVEVIACPIIRDDDGLALSSRNRYLSESERASALSISRGLREAAKRVADGERDADQLVLDLCAEMDSAGITKIDYVVIADPNTLQPIKTITAPAIALVAAHVGSTRLIDNLRLQP